MAQQALLVVLGVALLASCGLPGAAEATKEHGLARSLHVFQAAAQPGSERRYVVVNHRHIWGEDRPCSMSSEPTMCKLCGKPTAALADACDALPWCVAFVMDVSSGCGWLKAGTTELRSGASLITYCNPARGAKCTGEFNYYPYTDIPEHGDLDCTETNPDSFGMQKGYCWSKGNANTLAAVCNQHEACLSFAMKVVTWRNKGLGGFLKSSVQPRSPDKAVDLYVRADNDTPWPKVAPPQAPKPSPSPTAPHITPKANATATPTTDVVEPPGVNMQAAIDTVSTPVVKPGGADTPAKNWPIVTTSTTPPPDTEPKQQQQQQAPVLSLPAIIGVAVSGVVVLALLGVALWACVHARHQKQKKAREVQHSGLVQHGQLSKVNPSHPLHVQLDGQLGVHYTQWSLPRALGAADGQRKGSAVGFPVPDVGRVNMSHTT